MPGLETVSIITCTSDRPEAMQLCEKYVQRFETEGMFDIQWIVVDDGEEKTRFATATHLPDAFIVRKPSRFPVDSFRKNLVAGLRAVKGEYVCFCEDDDHYHRGWLRLCFEELQRNDIFGETAAKYYHVGSRRYQKFHPSRHASLAQTAIRAERVPWLINRIKRRKNSIFVDFDMWKFIKPAHLLPKSKMVISIKGMPGKRNLGVGSKMDTRGKLDHDGSVLRKWIGDDAELYEGFAVPHEAHAER